MSENLVNIDLVKVSIVMITYGHEEYIEEAINGVLMQDCSFNIELIISDDNSPDQTKLVVDKIKSLHPRGDIIKYTKHQKNKGPNSNFLWASRQCNGKYIAICEGDDYWTDNLKLQKQVDFLEINNDYGLVHGDVNHLNQQTGILTKAFNKSKRLIIPEGDILNDLYYEGHIIKAMTTCFRRNILEKYYLNDSTIMSNNWKLIDLSMWLVFAYQSKIKYIDEVFATYRLLPESMSRSKNPRKIHEFHAKIQDILAYFSEKYNATDKIKNDLKIRKIKSELIDAINMKQNNLVLELYISLKKNGGDLNSKEKIIYMLSRLKFFVQNLFISL